MSESKKEKTAYYISKNVNVDEMREIKENFEDPSKYLSLDPRIVVGLLPFKSKNCVQRLILIKLPVILPFTPLTFIYSYN